MDLLLSLSLLFVGMPQMATARHATTLSADVYWHTVLPNTPIPQAIKDLLRPNDAFGSAFRVNGITPNVAAGGNQNYGGGGNQRYGQGNNRDYGLAAAKAKVQDDPELSLFFLEKDLQPGIMMNLNFTQTISDTTPFIPREVTDTIPFSSKKLPEILHHLSIPVGTLEARTVENTLHECEQPILEGEHRYCATSLESMVDFVASELKTRDVMAVATMSASEHKLLGSSMGQYTIASPGARKIGGSPLVVCHSVTYPYAVFFCHFISDTKAYITPLVAKDGATVQAVAVCHTDTSKWNPKHIAFQLLKVQRGTPVCHFLEHEIIWAPKN